MKEKLIGVIILSLLMVACGQDPIFNVIANETAPVKPRIDGNPTNMVVFKRKINSTEVPIMYVASGRLYWYAKEPGAGANDNPQWDSSTYHIPQPGGNIISLAVTKDTNGERLYALCWRGGNSLNTELRYITQDGTSWQTLHSGNIQTIYADPDKPYLFAGSGSGSSSDGKHYTILCFDGAGALLGSTPNTSLLSGVASSGNDYYLSTKGSGIFKVTTSPFAITPLGGNNLFMSIIKLADNSIIAVEREGGHLFKLGSGETSFTQMSSNTGNYTTNALALWEDHQDTTKKLLIVGYQGGLYNTTSSSHTYGYVEFRLNTANGLDSNTACLKPNNLQSVDNNDRYMSSLGKVPIVHLFQAPAAIDPNQTFFASTQTKGLWSYRSRSNGGWQWNAED
jgi:hypothetical protein